MDIYGEFRSVNEIGYHFFTLFMLKSSNVVTLIVTE